MEWIITDFLNSEKALYLSAGIIGIVSIVVGILFLFISNYKSFAITLMVIGILESVVMFLIYLKYNQKTDNKISSYNNNRVEFLKSESMLIEKDLKSFFRLKLVYGILIILLIVVMSFLNPNSIFFGLFTALILHLYFAITIDNFGEIYTKKYQTELEMLPKN